MKKKLYLLTVSVLLCVSLTAQNKFSINGYFSPDYCNSFSKANSEIGEFIMAWNDSTRLGGWGLHTGVSANYKLSGKFSIGIGVNYSRHQINGIWFDIIVADSLQSFYPKRLKNSYIFEFINIPLQLKYHFNENKFRFYAHCSFSFQYFFSLMNYSTKEYIDGSIKLSSQNGMAGNDFDRFNIITSGGIGFAYHFSENIAVYTEPHFRYSLLSLVRDKDNSLTEHFYSIGLQSGIAWHF